MRWITLLTATLLIVVNLLGCTPQNTRTDPPDNEEQISNEDEVRLIAESERAAAEMQRKGLLLANNDLVSYVRQVGMRIAPYVADEVKLQFYVIRDPMVNAFARPYGAISGSALRHDYTEEISWRSILENKRELVRVSCI